MRGYARPKGVKYPADWLERNNDYLANGCYRQVDVTRLPREVGDVPARTHRRHRDASDSQAGFRPLMTSTRHHPPISSRELKTPRSRHVTSSRRSSSSERRPREVYEKKYVHFSAPAEPQRKPRRPPKHPQTTTTQAGPEKTLSPDLAHGSSKEASGPAATHTSALEYKLLVQTFWPKYTNRGFGSN
ncbi:hypothetical protein BKA67DRAFT_650223 [Truncatella angustata]|uniref:Uncharacterized protein n=1 Tax=Truncatella angustata TaxID=152316 RepID=A0A9P8UCS0_9PEZI|nr:uncharacterized protein BKA67DRAFT_650223 [Truncatella angustata]KAH6647031.1 hypothetical protein BKA67DRAFT_650223 [Truncatella angustata]